jgi:hypothetical protein
VPDVEKVNLAEKLALFSDHWNPRVVPTPLVVRAGEAFVAVPGKWLPQKNDLCAVSTGDRKQSHQTFLAERSWR